MPLVTQLYPPAVAAPIDEVARERGALWLPRGELWDAIAQQGGFTIATSRASLICPCRACPAGTRR